MAKRRRSIRYTREKIRRGKKGKFVTRGGRPGVVRIPKPPSKQSALPRYVVLGDGTRLLTTSQRGRASIPLLEFLRDRGLLLPELVEIDTARNIVHDYPDLDRAAVPPSWEEEPYEEMEEEFEEALERGAPESIEEAEAEETEEAMAERFEADLQV